MAQVKTIEWKDDKLILIDCTKLPLKEEYLICKKYSDLAKAIKSLAVRGAPAIGVSAAYGVVLAAIEGEKENNNKEQYMEFIYKAIEQLASTRPTAVNLFWALDRMKMILDINKELSKNKIKEKLLNEANLIYEEDIQCNKNIGKYGNEVIPHRANVLTHCNAGALATAGYGTALGVIRYAHHLGKNIHVYADETRPLLQGARLTTWELQKEDIPVTLITDNMAGYAMKLNKINLVITGADRITANGDTANKIGTYSVALLAKEHNIPFYIAAPISTIDMNLKSGDEIVIEERDNQEVREVFGQAIAPNNIDTFNPAFDVTPNEYITGIITEVGILRPPYNISIKNAMKL
ncbi:S-methyl-5-thioribose-1-phosphate isomerase [Clostridium lundense]|uniref:S-methyl-5-thioribose-1-phosphate isomerase n=1 Tax=Clostridium lundense TaxID=319475 RepID=UPI0004855AD3|nr:S-methyl-5-thioribose-1-phosphate isomerase [Clostridium lundense]